MFRAVLVVLASSAALACGSDPLRQTEGSSGDPPESPAPEEVALAIGDGDGSPESVTLFVVYEPEVARLPTGLDWNPSQSGELWVTLTEPAVDAPCTATVGDGCAALEGKMAIIADATGSSPVAEVAVDGNGWHFLRRPTGLAFGTRGTRQFFATCGEARTANYTDEERPYPGPVLWDADRALFGARPGPGMNGTHVDMLHETPYCMGVAHEQANVYWFFNGDAGSFDRYDFNEPHEPGGEDHSDGELWRYGEGELARVPGVPSHLAYDRAGRRLYAADSGNGRVVALDTTSGVPDGSNVAYETLVTNVRMSGAVVREVVPPGSLETPSGLTLERGVLFVTDHGTSRIVAFEPNGRRLRELDTGLPPNTLGAIAIGPDGKAYITDLGSGRVLRIER